MGMFSWCCKGCGHEISQGEYVRLNGCKGEYDGYGGNSGGFDYQSCNDAIISAWHDLCYRSASSDEKLDENPSKHAKNQGFGPAKLKYMKGYNENNPTTYTVVLYGDINGNDGQFFYTNLEKLQDQNSYAKLYEIEEEKLDFNFDEWMLLSDEDKEKASIDRKNKIEAIIGYPMPIRNEKVFNSVDEAISAVDSVLSRDLPVECNGCYSLYVFGHQGDIEGCVYERSVHERWDRSGGYKNWKKLDGLEESVVCYSRL